MTQLYPSTQNICFHLCPSVARNSFSFACQHFRQVNCLNSLTLFIRKALNVHETTRVVRHDVFSAALERGGALHFAHCSRDHGKLRGESAAETTTGFGLTHFHQ